MKFWTILIVLAIATISCKTDGTNVVTTKEASYPAVYQEFQVPIYKNGTLTSDVFVEDGRRQEWTTNISTENTFDEIFVNLKDIHQKAGWKLTKELRRDQEFDTESIILIFTNKGTKHSIFVIKETARLNKIRSSVIRYTS